MPQSEFPRGPTTTEIQKRTVRAASRGRSPSDDMPHWWKYIALRGAASLLCLLAAIGCSQRDYAAPANSPPQPSSAGYAYNKSADGEETERITAREASDASTQSAPIAEFDAPAPTAAPTPPAAPPVNAAPRRPAQSIAGMPGSADAKTRGEAAIVREPEASGRRPAMGSEPLRDSREPLLIYTAVLTLAVFGVQRRARTGRAAGPRRRRLSARTQRQPHRSAHPRRALPNDPRRHRQARRRAPSSSGRA